MTEERPRRAKLLADLRAFNGDDPEADHMLADSLLLKYIDDQEITQAFNNIKRWYA